MTSLVDWSYELWIWPVFVATVMTGCKPAPVIKETLAICVKDAGGASMFIDELRSIAADRNMKFIDDSDSERRRLAATNSRESRRSDGNQIIQVSVENGAGIGFWAVNDTKLGYQVFVAFQGKASDPKAQTFVDYTTKRLARNWPIRLEAKDGRIPAGFNACE